ncbi:phosphate signaling complex protein PhoU [Flavobacteriales bacterium]|nr:phosphate signaling complex protein PhoU [Flavobacteriales bacterium]
MTQIEQEISALRKELLNMFLAVNNQLQKSEMALLEFDKDLAAEITNAEKRINSLELKIDRDCENILALYSPVAVDLRFVLSVYKINHELERIADIADGIANYVNSLNSTFPKKAITEIKMVEMFAQLKAMMDNVIEAFEKENTSIARRVFKQDELLNLINSTASNVIIENYEESSAESLFYLLSCVRKLERAGDLTKNIAEELIFSIESKVIKHKKNRQ